MDYSTYNGISLLKRHCSTGGGLNAGIAVKFMGGVLQEVRVGACTDIEKVRLG